MPSGGTRAASPTILGFSLGFAFSLVGVGIAYLISVDNASGRTWRWFCDDSFEALGVIGGFAYLAYQVFHDGNLLVTFTRPVALAVAIALGYWWKRKSAGEPANRGNANSDKASCAQSSMVCRSVPTTMMSTVADSAAARLTVASAIPTPGRARRSTACGRKRAPLLPPAHHSRLAVRAGHRGTPHLRWTRLHADRTLSSDRTSYLCLRRVAIRALATTVAAKTASTATRRTGEELETVRPAVPVFDGAGTAAGTKGVITPVGSVPVGGGVGGVPVEVSPAVVDRPGPVSGVALLHSGSE